MLDNISAHRDWPVYINIFEHHPSQLNLIVQTGQKWHQSTYPRVAGARRLFVSLHAQ